MKVSVACGDPKVQVSGLNDGLELELVAHFLGMVLPDNDNMEPSISLPQLASASNLPKEHRGVTWFSMRTERDPGRPKTE